MGHRSAGIPRPPTPSLPPKGGGSPRGAATAQARTSVAQARTSERCPLRIGKSPQGEGKTARLKATSRLHEAGQFGFERFAVEFILNRVALEDELQYLRGRRRNLPGRLPCSLEA